MNEYFCLIIEGINLSNINYYFPQADPEWQSFDNRLLSSNY